MKAEIIILAIIAGFIIHRVCEWYRDYKEDHMNYDEKIQGCREACADGVCCHDCRLCRFGFEKE